MGYNVLDLLNHLKEFMKHKHYNADKLLIDITHETWHHLDMDMKGLIAQILKKRQLVVSAPWEIFVGKHNAKEILNKAQIVQNLSHQEEFIFYCRHEGLAKFREFEFEQQHQIQAEIMRLTRKALDFSNPAVIQKIIEDTFQLKRSAYTIGPHMCLIIFLSLLPTQERYRVLLIAEGKTYPLSQLNYLFSHTKVFYVTKIPIDDIWEKIMHMIAKTDPEQFVKLYNAACKRLGLSEENIVIDWETYSRAKSILENTYEYLIKVLRRHGYETENIK